MAMTEMLPLTEPSGGSDSGTLLWSNSSGSLTASIPTWQNYDVLVIVARYDNGANGSYGLTVVNVDGLTSASVQLSSEGGKGAVSTSSTYMTIAIDSSGNVTTSKSEKGSPQNGMVAIYGFSSSSIDLSTVFTTYGAHS